MACNEVLVPDRLYKVGRDIQPGYYLFSNLGVRDEEHPDVYFNMYPEHPPVSRYHRAEGYFGVAKLTEEFKYIKMEYGRALYYGKPFDLYALLNSVALPDNDYHPEGIIALRNELCTIRIFKQEKVTSLYHGDGDAEVYEQYLYSINDHKFWAGVFSIKSYRSYYGLAFGFWDSKEEQHYSFTQGCNFAGMCYSAKRKDIRLYRDKRGEFVEVELPQNINLDHAELEWILPTSRHETYTERLFRTKKTIRETYASEIEQITRVFQEYHSVGVDIDPQAELTMLEKSPDLLAVCLPKLQECLRVFPHYQQKRPDVEKEITFPVKATFNKRYYIAAKLADSAKKVKPNIDKSIYYVTFDGSQIEEIRLMCSILIDVFNTPEERQAIDYAYEYLYEYHYLTYLGKTVQAHITELAEKYGWSYYTYSPLSSIQKAIGKKISKKTDDLYQAMVRENRVTVRWGSEYMLFSLIREYVPDALYQYRVEWLGQQSFDIFIPSQNVAIEYQGKQHYEAVDLFGGEDALEDNRERDARKRALARGHGVSVLDWGYTTRVNTKNVQKFFEENGIKWTVHTPRSCDGASGTEMAPVRRNKPDNTPKEKIVRESKFVIRQFDVKGQFVAEHASFAEAAEKSQVSERAIRKVVYGERKTGGGFIWLRCHRDSEITDVAPVEYAENTGVAKKILQLNKDGEFIAEYRSIGQAVKQTGVSSRGISDVLAGVQKTAGGYVWVYR